MHSTKIPMKNLTKLQKHDMHSKEIICFSQKQTTSTRNKQLRPILKYQNSDMEYNSYTDPHYFEYGNRDFSNAEIEIDVDLMLKNFQENKPLLSFSSNNDSLIDKKQEPYENRTTFKPFHDSFSGFGYDNENDTKSDSDYEENQESSKLWIDDSRSDHDLGSVDYTPLGEEVLQSIKESYDFNARHDSANEAENKSEEVEWGDILRLYEESKQQKLLKILNEDTHSKSQKIVENNEVQNSMVSTTNDKLNDKILQKKKQLRKHKQEQEQANRLNELKESGNNNFLGLLMSVPASVISGIPFLLQNAQSRLFLPLMNSSGAIMHVSYKVSANAMRKVLNNASVYIDASPHMLAATNKLLDASGAVSESLYSASDHFHDLSRRFIHKPLMIDNPEIRHITALIDDPSWHALPLRCALASLTWSQLRLVKRTHSHKHKKQSETQASIEGEVKNTDACISSSPFNGDDPDILHKAFLPSQEDINNGDAEDEDDEDYEEEGEFLSAPSVLDYLKSLRSQVATALASSQFLGNNASNDVEMLDMSQQPTQVARADNVSKNSLVKAEVLQEEPWVDSKSSEPSSRKINSHSSDHWWLAERAEKGDIEAQYALAKWFCPPAFALASCCSTCGQSFGPRLFRHHCRACGRSFCQPHSSLRRAVPHLGLVAEVRVCPACAEGLDDEAFRNQQLWRAQRVAAYLCGQLLPFSQPALDTRADKALRVVDGSLLVAKRALFMNYPAQLVLSTAELLRRYGLSGLAGVLLRKDFFDAVQTLKRIAGLDSLFSMSLHELTACIYYKLAVDRGLRGCDPDGEKRAHDEHARENGLLQGLSEHPRAQNDVMEKLISSLRETENSSEESNSDENNDNSESNGENAKLGVADEKKVEKEAEKEVVSDEISSDLMEAIKYAPLALEAVYEANAVECQRLALSQGWETILCQTESAPEQPAYALFATSSFSTSSSAGVREAVLAVRGTSSVQDLVTDIRAAPIRFPPARAAVVRALAGEREAEPQGQRYGASTTVHEGEAEKETVKEAVKDEVKEVVKDVESEGEKEGEFVPVECEQWEWTKDMLPGERYACRGMAVSALWLVSQVAPALSALCARGVKVTVTGHSLGAGVAALAVHMLRERVPNIRAVLFGCPNCCDALTADELKSSVLSVVLRDDFISRVTPTSLRALVRELILFRAHVFRHLAQDWRDVTARAASLWSPRWREEGGERGGEQGGVENPHEKGSERSSERSSEEEEALLVPEEDIAELWLPGKLLHIYSYRGQYRASHVTREFEGLRKIQIQGSLFADHSASGIFDALLVSRAVLSARASPPAWTPFHDSRAHGDRCMLCRARFTWHATFRGQAAEYRERLHCRACGRLVCAPCSSKKRPVLRLGLALPVRICDQCFFRGDYARIE